MMLLLGVVFFPLVGLTGTNQEQVAILLGPCLDELGMLVNIAPPSYKTDLLAICFYIFSGKKKKERIYC